MPHLHPTTIPLDEELRILRQDIKNLKSNHEALRKAIQHAIDVLEATEAEIASRQNEMQPSPR